MTVSTAAGVATSYRYDGANRLSSVAQGATTLGEYIYNNDGLRVRKTEAGKTTYYVYDGSQCVYTEEYVGAATTASKQLVNTYLSGMNLATYDALTSTYTYNLLDHLGSRRKVISKLGAVVESIDLDIFGNQVTGTNQNYRFTDKEKDSATGLVYFNARYYNPNLGRFITEDPIRDGINWYAYCANNPLKFVDPWGLETVMTIHVNQPGNGGDRDTWEMINGVPNTGHAMVQFQNTETGLDVTVGFYPNYSNGDQPKDVLFGDSVPGRVKDDSSYETLHPGEIDVSKTYTITDNDLAAALDYIAKVGLYETEYDLEDYNCVDFVIGAAAAAGVDVPDTQGDWGLGSGSNPGDLGEDLRGADCGE